jgi:hypothetical protein
MSNKVKPLIPKYFEFESFRRSMNRRLWFGMGILALVALFSLFLAMVAFARPVPVVVFDRGSGQPILFEDTKSPRITMTDIRVEYLAKEFIRFYVGIDSANLVDDLEHALGLMTPVFRKIVMSGGKELERRNQYKDQNLKTVISSWNVRIGKYNPDDEQGKIHVLVIGKMKFEPKFGKVETPPGEVEKEVARWFMSQVVMQRVPVTKISIHGLLVDFCHTAFFDTKEDLDRHLLEEASRP